MICPGQKVPFREIAHENCIPDVDEAAELVTKVAAQPTIEEQSSSLL